MGLALGSQTGHPGKGKLSEGHLSWGFSSPGLIHQVVLQQIIAGTTLFAVAGKGLNTSVASIHLSAAVQLHLALQNKSGVCMAFTLILLPCFFCLAAPFSGRTEREENDSGFAFGQ